MLSKTNRRLRRAWFVGFRLSREAFSLLLLLLSVAVSILLVLHIEAGVRGTPLRSLPGMLEALEKSPILGAVESVAIITGFIIFISSGRKQQRMQYRADALSQMETSQDLRKSGATKVLLEGLNRKGESLRGLVFIQDLNLDAVDLPNVNLSRVLMPGAKLINAQLDNAIFHFAKMEGAIFEMARLKGADFKGACLQNSDFSRSRLQAASFEKANLEGCIFRFAELKGTDFREAKYLPLEQIILADSWEKAIFDLGVKESLIALSKQKSDSTEPQKSS
jgi:uncharacterized protein YjbI with pentapeptide repeats